MQPERRSFFARGGSYLIVGVVLATISLVFSLVPALGGPDPFTLVAGENTTFQLHGIGIYFALGYFTVVGALVATGLCRLIESTHTASKKPEGTEIPKGTDGLHPTV